MLISTFLLKGDASGTNLMDIRTKLWNEEVNKLFEFESQLLSFEVSIL